MCGRCPMSSESLFRRVVPEAPTRPQGGGRRRHGDREVLAAIVAVTASGCTWQQLPSASFGPSGAAAHRRFTEVEGQSVGEAPPLGPRRTRCPRRAGTDPLRDRLGAHTGAQKGEPTGPNPVDRGKYGTNIHLIAERNGLPLPAGISSANVHDSQALIPLVQGTPPIRSQCGRRRRRPDRLHGDKGYNHDHLRRWLRGRDITPRIARKGTDFSQRLGRHAGQSNAVAWLPADLDDIPAQPARCLPRRPRASARQRS